METLGIDVNPVPCPRPRVSKRGHAYYPAKYKHYKVELGEAIAAAWGDRSPLDGSVEIVVDFHVEPPKKSKLTHPKPDIDNYVKGLFDAMNGVVFNDDCQVIKVTATKQWADSPSDVGMYVEVISHG